MKGSRALLKMLEDRDVTKIFGYPGGTVIPIYDEILNSPIDHVLVRHEQCAGHMADVLTLRAYTRGGLRAECTIIQREPDDKTEAP